MARTFRIREFTVPLFIVAIAATMIIPIPPALMDCLLVGNLVLALVLLVSSFSITEPIKLSALPSILLIATLYRLALNISTTRLILGSGNAGEVVEAFGKVVVGGNLVVGMVVFLIITLVQFIVVAKGSERVAEVSARFTLDALPGKQMSIDADLRAGLIDANEARDRRLDLQCESRFYGALDGAMKFVKGDSIAGLVVTAINVIGGLAVGVFTYHLGFAEAVSKYTLLTVGDGLVSQIPALLNAVAAGIIVTRVTRGDDVSLSVDLIGQLSELKQVRIIVGILCALLAVAPGVPAIPFLVVAVGFILSATSAKNSSTEQQNIEEFSPNTPAVLAVEISQDKAQSFSERVTLSKIVEEFRRRVYEKHGLYLLRPDFSIEVGLEVTYQIKVRGVVVRRARSAQAGAELLQEILEKVEEVIRKSPAELIDDTMTRRLLDQFDASA
ncbi:MAG: FHIPEP family type III secretion protein, partial [Bdellovibrionales bacterium]|nr:FHIPEP family type III secretion protein [Bdellovibrionales bacterium]